MLSVNCLLFRKDNYIRNFVKCLSEKYFVKPRGPTAMLLSNVPTSGFIVPGCLFYALSATGIHSSSLSVTLL